MGHPNPLSQASTCAAVRDLRDDFAGAAAGILHAMREVSTLATPAGRSRVHSRLRNWAWRSVRDLMHLVHEDGGPLVCLLVGGVFLRRSRHARCFEQILNLLSRQFRQAIGKEDAPSFGDVNIGKTCPAVGKVAHGDRARRRILPDRRLSPALQIEFKGAKRIPQVLHHRDRFTTFREIIAFGILADTQQALIFCFIVPMREEDREQAQRVDVSTRRAAGRGIDVDQFIPFPSADFLGFEFLSVEPALDDGVRKVCVGAVVELGKTQLDWFAFVKALESLNGSSGHP